VSFAGCRRGKKSLPESTFLARVNSLESHVGFDGFSGLIILHLALLPAFLRFDFPAEKKNFLH
jgi:hypothetical protein